MVKHYCDLCGELVLDKGFMPSLVIKEGATLTFYQSVELCKACIVSMSEWAASRKK